MSFEGYYQVLCEQGHYIIIDVYNFDEFNHKCPICQSKVAWWNIVDETNCESVGYIELDVKEPTKKCMCDKCGYEHDIGSPTYYIPDEKDIKHEDFGSS